jgi:hypothetical protein
MFDIADKNKLIEQIMADISMPSHYDNSYGYGSIEDKIKIIANAQTYMQLQYVVPKIVESIISHLYTYSEFEKDLGLKD